MGTHLSMIIRNSPLESTARCLVCGSDIPQGEGLTIRFQNQTLRFKCADCLTRFEAEPERYLAGHASGCCREDQEHSPVSEWRCD